MLPKQVTMVVPVIVLLGAVVLVLASAVKQLVRERLVATLIAIKHQDSMLVSEWIAGRLATVQAVKREYIWGKSSRELRKIPQTRNLIGALRLCDILQWLGFATYPVSVLVFFVDTRGQEFLEWLDVFL